MDAILSDPACRVQGFLLAGHVCTVMGYHEYLPLLQKYRIPMVVTGFEPLDLACGILETIRMLEQGRFDVVNAYSRAVSRQGNRRAQQIINEVLEPCDRKWRGIGLIPMSGWRLRPEFQSFDAELRFEVQAIAAQESPLCIAGQVLQGLRKPADCPAFGGACVPEHPLGATMVSSEGACAAYYRYGRVTIPS
jgi:hydrogenase expression/formation protein HypD